MDLKMMKKNEKLNKISRKKTNKNNNKKNDDDNNKKSSLNRYYKLSNLLS